MIERFLNKLLQLLHDIQSCRLVSIGSFDSHYKYYANKDTIDALEKDVAKALKNIPRMNLKQSEREKAWQIKAGRMAVLASWALDELIDKLEPGTPPYNLTKSYLDEIQQSGLLDFDESE